MLKAGRPRGWAAGLSASVALVVGGLTACQAGEAERADPEPLSPAAVALSLHLLEAAVSDADPAAAARLAAPDDAVLADRLSVVVANARSLGVVGLTLTAGALPESRAEGVVVPVQVSWRLRGLDARPARMTVPIGFGLATGRVVVTSLGSVDDPGPLWLQAPLRVTRRGGLLLASVGPAPDVARAVPEALRAVRRVLPGWRPRGLIEVPASGPGFAAALSADPGEYSHDAAVTTTVDGTADPAAATRVVVNRDRFADMTAQGARIVLSHELTHVATGGVTSAAPWWLVEGFADYVALRGRRATDPAMAPELVRLVRRDGPPSALPGPAEFATGGARLAAAYQGAWLAAWLIADRSGERALVRVHDRVSAGAPLAAVLRQETGRGPAAWVRVWRGRLTHWSA